MAIFENYSQVRAVQFVWGAHVWIRIGSFMATGGYTESFGYILYLELNRHSVIVINFFFGFAEHTHENKTPIVLLNIS